MTAYQTAITRWRKHALHVIANAGAYKKSEAALAWRFIAQHGSRAA